MAMHLLCLFFAPFERVFDKVSKQVQLRMNFFAVGQNNVKIAECVETLSIYKIASTYINNQLCFGECIA